MAKSRGKYAVTVGLFIFSGILILAAGIILIGRQNDLFTKSISVKSYFKDVKGLQPGNNIHFEGVKVGIVKSVEFTKNFEVEVVLKIERKFVPYLYSNMKAKISADGLVGNKMIILSGGTEGSVRLKENDVLTTENSFSPEDLLVRLETTNSNIEAITENLKIITGRIVTGKGSVGKLISDERMYENIQAVIHKLNRTADHTENFALAIENYVAKFKTEGSIPNELVTDTLIFTRFRQAGINVKQITDDIVVIAEHLKKVSGNFTQPNSPAGVLFSDTTSAEKIKHILENLNLSSEKLNKNLDALQHNFLLRGYFRKMKKKEQNTQTDKKQKN